MRPRDLISGNFFWIRASTRFMNARISLEEIRSFFVANDFSALAAGAEFNPSFFFTRFARNAAFVEAWAMTFSAASAEMAGADANPHAPSLNTRAESPPPELF